MLHASQDTRAKLRGFSFVELLITMVLGAVLFLGASRFSIMSTRSLAVESMKQRVEERVQVAMTRLRSDIRYLAYDPSATLSSGTYITTAQAGTLVFRGDLDGDNVLETVTYRQQGSVFERSVDDENGGQFSPVATNLKALTFTYYDSAGAVTAVLANIKKIHLELTFQSEGKDALHDPITFRILTVKESFVPRNLLL